MGFIALFGIAVLNGIVLIEHYKELRDNQYGNLKAVIIEGTVSRLRPVLLTASAAAMGFLPMAISTSAGAEVQWPLATVVIGGLITATALTLMVLPVLYYLLAEKQFSLRLAPKMLVLVLPLLPLAGFSQSPPLSLQEVIQIAKENNAKLQAQQVLVERQEALKGAAFNFDKTLVYYGYDENNIAPNNLPLRVWGVQQDFRFPTTYRAERKLSQAKVERERWQYAIEERIVEEEVSKAYYHMQYLFQLKAQYQFLDSIYARFSSAAARRFALGESNALEKLTAESKQNEIQMQLDQVEKDLAIGYATLKQWMQTDFPLEVVQAPLERVAVTAFDSLHHPVLRYLDQEQRVTEYTARTLTNNWLPDIQLEYFQGTNRGAEAQMYTGFQVGLGIPLLYGTQKSKVKANKLDQQWAALQQQDYKYRLSAR